MKLSLQRVLGSAVAMLLAGSFASASIASAAEESALFLNLNASDPGSYDSADPSKWRSLSTPSVDGQIVGSLAFNSITKALEFPGGTNSTNSLGYVDMGPGFNDFGQGITIEFEGHFGQTNQAWERIFDFGNGDASDNIWVGVLGEGAYPNRLAIELFHGSTGKGRCISADPILLTEVSGAQRADVFAKYVITLDGTLCRMYKNGVEVDTSVGLTSFPNRATGSTYSALPLNVERANNYIGRSNWGTDAAFDGAIKYVRIYTAALSANDVENNAASYTLTYSTSGSDSGSAPTPLTGNGLVTLAANPGNLVKDGHTFDGWATSVNQSSGIDGSYNLTANTTLFPAFTPNSYTVTYLEHDGSNVPDGSFLHGGSLTYPTNPTRAGYSFLGWFDAQTGGTARTASSVAAANANATLHAQWNPNTYAVSYNEQGGSTVPDGSYVYGSTLTFPIPPTRDGYSFAGWFLNPTGGSALTASAVSSVTSDVTLHAQWTPLPAQTVTWSPSVSLTTDQSPATPNAAAQSSGDGVISYAVRDAGATGCTVNSVTGVLTYSGVGTCTVRAMASSTQNFVTGHTDVAFTIGSIAPAMSLNLDLAQGDEVANSEVDFGASGLKSNSPWSLVLRSTPQTLSSGTYSGSVVSGSAQIPAGLSAGWHSITLSGLSPTGTTISHAVWFEVSSSGALLRTSPTDPTEVSSDAAVTSALPLTGQSHKPLITIGALFLSAGLLLTLAWRRPT